MNENLHIVYGSSDHELISGIKKLSDQYIKLYQDLDWKEYIISAEPENSTLEHRTSLFKSFIIDSNNQQENLVLWSWYDYLNPTEFTEVESTIIISFSILNLLFL